MGPGRGLPGGSVVKNSRAMQEIQVPSLAQEDPLEEGMTTYSSILAWRIPTDRGAWSATVHRDHKESDRTEVTTHTGDRNLKVLA